MAMKAEELHPETTLKQWWMLTVLLFIYICNQWVRYLLNNLYGVSGDDPYSSLATATGISTAQYGLLVGFGFSLGYVLMGMVMGRASDLYRRVNIIGAGLIIWSGATLQMGTATNYYGLLAARVFQGLGQSFTGPASYSLIADAFPPGKRAEANGIYAFGVYVGGGLGSLSIAMAIAIGWRATCYFVGGLGFVLALILFATVGEPARQSGTPTAPVRKMTATAALKASVSSPLLILLMLAGSVRFMAGFALGGYLTVFYSTAYPDYNELYSYLNASVISVGGAASSYLGGMVADKWAASGEQRAYMIVPALGALLSFPALFAALYVPSFYVSLAFLLLEYLFAECWFGPAMSTLQGAVPPGARGVAIALWSLLTTISGSGMSYFMGLMLEDDASADSVRLVLMSAAGSSYLAAACLFALSSHYVGRTAPGATEETLPLLPHHERQQQRAESTDEDS